MMHFLMEHSEELVGLLVVLVTVPLVIVTGRAAKVTEQSLKHDEKVMEHDEAVIRHDERVIDKLIRLVTGRKREVASREESHPVRSDPSHPVVVADPGSRATGRLLHAAHDAPRTDSAQGVHHRRNNRVRQVRS